ncbi:MAG: hypothetical protein IPI69_04275 [Bacteroidales bacterium]|nr:hypothetical protein [Bacteroidales bacterium]
MKYAKRFTFNFHLQIESTLQFCTWYKHHSPGGTQGIDGDTSGVRNRKITSVLRVSLPIATMPDDDDAIMSTSLEGWPSSSPGFARDKGQ